MMNSELELGVTGILTMLFVLGFLSAPFATMRLLGAGITSGLRGIVMLVAGCAGALAYIGFKSLEKSKKWKPAPEQTFEPASRNYPASPERSTRPGRTYEGPSDQSRLVEVKPDQIQRIGSQRPVKK